MLRSKIRKAPLDGVGLDINANATGGGSWTGSFNTATNAPPPPPAPAPLTMFVRPAATVPMKTTVSSLRTSNAVLNAFGVKTPATAPVSQSVASLTSKPLPSPTPRKLSVPVSMSYGTAAPGGAPSGDLPPPSTTPGQGSGNATSAQDLSSQPYDSPSLDDGGGGYSPSSYANAATNASNIAAPSATTTQAGTVKISNPLSASGLPFGLTPMKAAAIVGGLAALGVLVYKFAR